MTSLENLEIARKLYEEFNEHNFDAMAALCDQGVKYTDMVTGQTYEGSAGFLQSSQRWIGAFPDGRVEIVNQLAAGDAVVTEFVGHGTHEGPLEMRSGSIPATHKPVELSCCEVLRFRDGKVVVGRMYYDVLTLLHQLGVAPALGRPAAAPEEQAEAPSL
jgi:steroid delta-isomerase-like uncharacterized protein